MNIKHQDLDIPEDEPFKNCKLERRKYAFVLTDIVKTYSDGFVLAINNEWGTGKTTFVKMWQKHLKLQGFNTVYFNAWENDFDSNPLVAIMSELKALTNPKYEKLFKSVVQKGAVLVKHTVPELIKAIAKRYIGIDLVVETIGNTAEGAAKILQDEIEEYTHKKKTIQNFRDDLEEFVRKTNIDRPLVFIIDELDRCRPNYAVEVLEQMKHFFSVPGIVFVLSIDKNHLASAVRGFYGSEHINTEEYLRRFIDLEYSIPAPPMKSSINYFFDYYAFDDFFSSGKRRSISELQSEADLFCKVAELLLRNSNATLRHQEKIFALSRLIILSFQYNQYTFSHLLFSLVYIKLMKNDLFHKIDRNVLSIQELSDAFSDLFPPNTKKLYGINTVYLQALLLQFYNNNQEPEKRMELYKNEGENGRVISPITSRIDNDRYSLANAFYQIDREFRYNDTSLSYLLNRLNLIEPIQIT